VDATPPKKIASSLGERNQTIVLSDAKAAARVTAMSKRKQPMDSDGVEESEDDAIGDARTLRSTLCPSRDRSLRIRCRKETICRRRKRKWTGGVTEGGEAREKNKKSSEITENICAFSLPLSVSWPACLEPSKHTIYLFLTLHFKKIKGGEGRDHSFRRGGTTSGRQHRSLLKSRGAA
jgi:hypothetical protein